MAVRFSAANQRYLAGGFSGTVVTILCWARIATDTDASADIWVLYNGTETTTEAGLGTAGDGTSMLLFDPTTSISGPVMTVGTWYCFAAVLNGTAWSLYYGTDPQSLSTASGTKTAISSPASMTISQAVEPWNGNVAAFKMYTAALSLAEVQNELTQYQPVRTANLLRYHPFVNAELIDYSGNGNALTAGAGTATTEPGPPIRWEGRWLERHMVKPTSVSASVNAGVASVSMSGQNPTVHVDKVSVSAGSAAVSLTARAPTLSTSPKVAAGSASVTLTSHGPTPGVKASAGTGPIVAMAWDGVSSHQSLACANLSATIVPVRLSAIITLGDELSADITPDLLDATVGKDEYFADVGICGRS